MVVVLDDEDRVVAASKRAREALERASRRAAPRRVSPASAADPIASLRGRRAARALVYLEPPGDLTAYEELRAGFTAAVSHELRTPLARLLALLETAMLPARTPER